MTTAFPDLAAIRADAVSKAHELYKQLHAAPELSMQEHKTAALIEQQLAELGIANFRCGGTGVVGVLRRGEGPVVAFRADIDGLPLQEASGLPYASTVRAVQPDGTDVPVMHGCGHDVHVAALVATAEVLVRDESWNGTVILIFQPGEETGEGADAMVEDGLWDRVPKPEVVYGQHVVAGPAGSVSLREGPTLSSADSLRVVVKGRGSHASAPQDSVDPIVLGAYMITRLQTIVSREVAPSQAAVVTIGTFAGGLKENIIPESAEFTVNVRTFDPGVRTNVLASIRRIVQAEALASGAPEPFVEVISEFPQCVNDSQATTVLRERFTRLLGPENVMEAALGMASEDFGRLSEAIGVPAVFWFFGGYKESGDYAPQNHSPRFAPDLEPTLTTAVRLATGAILGVVGPEATPNAETAR